MAPDTVKLVVCEGQQVIDQGKILAGGDAFEISVEAAEGLVESGSCELADGAKAKKKGSDASAAATLDDFSDEDILAEAIKRSLIDPPPVPYEDQHVDELQAQVDDRQLEVEGSGKDGGVVKADLVAALEKADEADPAATA